MAGSGSDYDDEDEYAGGDNYMTMIRMKMLVGVFGADPWADPAECMGDDIRMTMMLMRMLTVILVMRLHEYDNDDDAFFDTATAKTPFMPYHAGLLRSMG